MTALSVFIAHHFPPHDARMLWAACTSAFFGLLRSSEYTCPSTSTVSPASLTIHHLTIRQDYSRISLYLPISKNDQFGKGVLVHMFPLQSPLCPVSALIHYLTLRQRVHGPLFRFENGQFLTRQHIVDIIRATFPHQPDLNTHSFRVGGASALSDAGVPDQIIQIMGRWSSDSFLRYIHIPPESVREYQGSMASQSHT